MISESFYSRYRDFHPNLSVSLKMWMQTKYITENIPLKRNLNVFPTTSRINTFNFCDKTDNALQQNISISLTQSLTEFISATTEFFISTFKIRSSYSYSYIIQNGDSKSKNEKDILLKPTIFAKSNQQIYGKFINSISPNIFRIKYH